MKLKSVEAWSGKVTLKSEGRGKKYIVGNDDPLKGL